MSTKWIRTAYLAAAIGLAATAPAAIADGDTSASNKWRIEVSEGANTAGTIAFRVTPSQGSGTDIAVDIAEGRSENDIADDIRDALAAKLPADRYTVETDDGEDVLVKKVDGQPDFTVALVSSDVEGTRVNLQHE
jgi:hypothetical protein